VNPALPLLAFLSLAGLLLRRREIGIPWAACGLAGIALLWPALRLPDGIPSPAATLAAEAPWQGVAAPAAGNPNLRDLTWQVEPWLIFLRHEMRAGRLPFWDPHQFSGSPYWSNGSGAPLFPLHLLFVLLPLQLGWVLLPWLRTVLGGCGAWCLARELGASRPAALLAALVFPLSGMITSFLLFPMGNTHALVPWVLLAVERLANGRGGWRGLAVAGGLQMLGGHPETPVFTALLAAVYLLARGSARPLATWGRFVAGWGVAALLSAIQLLPLFLTLTRSGKWLHPEAAPAAPLAAVGAVLLRAVLPDLFGNPAVGTWWGPFNFAATAVYAGALTLPLAAAGLGAALGRGGDRRWRGVAAMTLFALLAAYQLFGMRTLLLALPVVSRGLHHYMKLGVELGLALLAAAGCDRWLAGKGRGLVAGAGLTLALLAVAWWRFGEGFRDHGLLATEAAWTAWIAATVSLLALSLLLTAERRWSVLPLLPALLAIDLIAAHGRTNPGLSNARHFPATGAVRFLRGRPERLAGLGGAFHPDAAMVYGLYDVRGDSPVKLQPYDDVYADLGEADPVYFHPIRNWSSPWLDRLGVRWVVAGPAETPPAGLAWRLAYAGRDARVFERPGALPLARLEGAGQARVEARSPGVWRIAWQAAAPARLVVAETWDPGWRATLDGRPVAIAPRQGVLMTVPVGPGSGHVELRYHPDGFVPGMLLSALGLGALAAGTFAARARGRDQESHPESRHV